MSSQSEETIFEAALGMRPEARGAYLDQTCKDNPGLRQRLEVLLQAHEQADEFMAEPAAASVETLHIASPLTEKPGDKIDHYKLLQQIGEGGCGVVYMAEQEEPIRRRVAFKVIKLGMDTRQVIARFEAERQALALMDHPNIAKVLDAGATDAGRPYFVMELVRGIRITEYCDQNILATEVRLDLFTQVCHAIQHAHQKGIIHRDIKPSNILVTVNDGVPVPKVIDFGIAKATEQRLTDKTLFTAFEQFIGTPAYMSPEQAEMTSLDIDTRSDIYALGVLLYELLTGHTPFEAKDLVQMGLDEMRRIIREQEPVRPSTRISALREDERTTVARRRQLEAPKLVHQVQGDLDWIVMKCLEKDRTRRYDTATGLANDIGRHLRHEAVSAVAPTFAYQFSRYIRRHRLALAIISAFIALLVVGSVVSTWQAIRATRNAAEAERQAARADHNALEQAHQRQRAETVSADLAASLERLELQRAEVLFLAGDARPAIASLARLLRQHPTNYVAAERLLSALTYRTFARPLTPPLRHGGWIWSGGFSPDGRVFATGCGDHLARIWDAQTGQLLHTLPEDSTVLGVQFSPDGSLVLTSAGEDGKAHVWETATGRLLHELAHPDSWALRAQFSPDGHRVVTVGGQGKAVLWDTVTGLPVVTNAHKLEKLRGLGSVSFSPDARWVATCPGDASAQIWNVASGRLRCELKGHQEYIAWLEYSPDGECILTAGFDRTARIWNAATGEPIRRLDHLSPVFRARYSRDGRRIVTATIGRTGNVWDARTGELVCSVNHGPQFRWTEFSPDGLQFTTASSDGTARVWDTESGRALSEAIKHEGSVEAARFSGDGRKLLTFTAEGSARVWNATLNQAIPLALWDWGQTGFECLYARICPDGHRALTTVARNATLRDTRTGRAILPKPIGFGSFITYTQLSPDAKRVATGSNEGLSRIWDATSGKLLVGPLVQTGRVSAIEFSPDDRWVATTTILDHSARVWDSHSGRQQWSFPHSNEIYSVAFDPHSRWLVTASVDRTAVVWDLATGQPIHALCHPDKVGCAAFSHDGRVIVTGSSDKNARLWDAAAGQLLCSPLQHSTGVGQAYFSPDDRLLLTVASDNIARVWDLSRTNALIGSLEHRAQVQDAQFSPDGRRIVTGAMDGSVRLWDVGTGLPISESLEGGDAASGAQVYSAQFSPDGQRVIAACRDGAARIWETPRLTNPPPAWFGELAEAVAETRADDQGILGPVPFSTLEALRRQLAGSTGADFWSRWAAWFFAEPSERAISPFASITMPDYIHQRLQENTAGSLREVVRLAPNDAVAWARLGRAVLRSTVPDAQQPLVDAAAYYQRASQLAPDHFESLWTRAEVCDRRGQLAEALEAFDRAAARQPTDPAFWLSCGALHGKTNQAEEAIKAYSKAIELAESGSSSLLPIKTKALLGRAELYHRLGREEEARSDQEKAKLTERSGQLRQEPICEIHD